MQVELAWLLRRAKNILLIPGTSSVAHLEENLAAARLELPEKAMELLEGISGREWRCEATRAWDPKPSQNPSW